MAEQFTCADCGEVFDKDCSDEEAAKEMMENFHVPWNVEHIILCDDCYKRFMSLAE